MGRYLYFRNIKTGEEAGNMDMTGKSDRHVETVMRGMIRNIGDDWIAVDDNRPAKGPE